MQVGKRARRHQRRRDVRHGPRSLIRGFEAGKHGDAAGRDVETAPAMAGQHLDALGGYPYDGPAADHKARISAGRAAIATGDFVEITHRRLV